jgi:hypothetical protein
MYAMCSLVSEPRLLFVETYLEDLVSDCDG